MKKQIIKQCGRCLTSYTLDKFEKLAWVGEQKCKDEQGEWILELRNCPCGSTLAIERDSNGKLLL